MRCSYGLRRLTAVAWSSAVGEQRQLREDVGRHNPLDKVIGALTSSGIEARSGFIVVTIRAGFEVVQKIAAAGVALLAITPAGQARLALVGFVRDDAWSSTPTPSV